MSREISLAAGTVRFFEDGPADGPVVLFVHGLLVNADLWRRVVPEIARAGLRTLAVDWPLGAHHLPMPRVDYSPPGLADLIASFMAELDIRDVTVVANDTGGALTQILMTRHPDRIGRVVLTPSDSFARFFPPMFALLPLLAKVPGGTWLLVRALQLGLVQRSPLAFGRLAKRPIPREALDSYIRPAREDPRIRRDLRAFLRQVHRRHTLAAAGRLHHFTRPVLLAWAPEDTHFPIELAERLAALLPAATISRIEDSLTFVPEDQPAVLAHLVTDFVENNARA
ncbi:alpha/beta hydrolase [Actinokineospora sp. NBRC 105648]|uniref:alpha/beta fold hydrolase n=1 Tax=Actinokineospora sp. NBRC 105648 TaxID=3032206 RepID=UPI0024A20748|nr:alpha/beta hydrolase [Actinokineospora sp. NBRC 105648]GLZ37944.1 alpha/beta hydrolase [Actinokineospora sp. NBRC 105648]